MAAVNVTFPGNLAQVKTAADLRSVPSTLLPLGALFLVNGLEGLFEYDPGSLAVDDGADVLRPVDKTPGQVGRWIRNVDGLATGPRGLPGGNAMALGLALEVPLISLNTPATAGNDYFQTTGYSAVGVGAARYYRKPAGAPAAFGDLVSADGVRIGIAEDVLRPEMFGILGDGSDELDRLQKLFDLAPGVSEIRIGRTHKMAFVAGKEALFVRSNSRIVFDGGKLELLPHNLDRYEMLMLSAVSNVEIVSPVLDGRRDLNAASAGEYGNGIQILGGCENILITDPVTNNMWGDGIFIGQEIFITFAVPRNITVVRHRADNCRRQGMSITGGRGVKVQDPVWTNTNGTLPAAGLDIEPDRADSVLTDIQIINPITRGNAGSGILVYLRPLRATTDPVSILITNHDGDGDGKTDGSGAQFKSAGFGGSYARGLIRYVNPVVRRGGVAGILIEDWDARGPQIDIDRPTVIDPNERNIGLAFVRAGISIWNGPDGDAATIGNVSIRNPTITDTRTTPRSDRHIFVRNEKGVALAEKIEVIDPVRLNGATFGTSWVDAKARVSDSLRVTTVNYPVDVEIGTSNHVDLYTNIGATEAVTWMLSQVYPVGAPDFEIFADGGFPIIILPDSGSAIVPGGGVGKRVTVPVNSRVRLRRKNATTWVIVSSTGPLTFEA